MKKVNYFGCKIYAPDWATCIATDDNGDAFFYTGKPLFDRERKKWVNMSSSVVLKVKQKIDFDRASEHSLELVSDILIDDHVVMTVTDQKIEIKNISDGYESNDFGKHYNFTYKGIKLDPYRIFDVYEIKSAPQQHAIKKLLRAGNSVKDLKRDISEVVATLERWLEMIDEDL